MDEFKALFESIPGLFLVVVPNTPHFTIVAASQAYLDQTRKTTEQVVGHDLLGLLPLAKAESHFTPSSESLHELYGVLERTHAAQAYTVRGDLGPEEPTEGRPVEDHFWKLTFAPVTGRDGQVRYLIVRMEDTSESSRLQLEQLKHELMTQVSHELNTPLTSMMLNLELLTRQRDGTLKSSDLDRAVAASRQLKRLIENALSFRGNSLTG